MNTIIQTPTGNLQESLDFYSRLNFQVIPREKGHLVSDGQCLLLMNPDRYARAGVRLFRSSWKSVLGKLEDHTAITSTKDGFLLSDPNGVWIYLIEGEPDLDMDIGTIPASTLGNFAGISLESTDIPRSQTVWELLGFTKTMGSAEQGWICVRNEDQLSINIMRPHSCPHLFFNPSLTYFNGKVDNPKIIQKIRDAGIPITEEITHFNPEGIVDNIIIRDPGGLGFFVFND